MQPSEYGESSRPTHEILRESEERFRLLVEGVKDYAIFMLDADGYITTWNIGAQRIKGYESEEIIGEHFSIFYTDEDIERGHPDEELRIAAADGSYEEEGIRVRKDGAHFWASVLITALRDEEGDLRGFAKVTRDITARKVAEERDRLLAASKRPWRGPRIFWKASATHSSPSMGSGVSPISMARRSSSGGCLGMSCWARTSGRSSPRPWVPRTTGRYSGPWRRASPRNSRLHFLFSEHG